MKKAINGKVYDTETARKVGEYSPDSYSVTDWAWYSEALYHKRSGEYFLYGEGGPKTQYAQPYGPTGWQSGERIMPLTYDAAEKWAEEHLDADLVEREFSLSDDTETKTALTARVTARTRDIAERNAARAGVSISEYIESLITGASDE